MLIRLIAKTFLIKYALQAAYFRKIRLDKELLDIVLRPACRPTAARALKGMCIGMSTRPAKFTAPKLLKRLSEISNRPPFLLIWGKQDRFVPLMLGEKLLCQYPWLELSVLDQSGHCPHDECFQKFNNEALTWLKLNLEVT